MQQSPHLSHFFCLALLSFSLKAETNKELLDKLVQQEAHGNILKVFETPDKQTNISMEYSFKELKLKPRDVLYFYVPENLSLLPLSQIGFSHRQVGRQYNRDYNPGLTSALIYTKDIPDDEFRYWGGHASGKLGAKFAEYRSSPEFDALYEWPKVGHRGIVNRDRNTTLIKANVVRIQNVGTDDVAFSKLYLETVSEKANIYQNVVFTPGSDFGDPLTLNGRYYGGGQNKRGRFPEALKLDSQRRRGSPSLPANMSLENNNLVIQLPTGAKLKSIDIMCGDTHPDGVRNKDGGWGTLGSAKLSIKVRNKITGVERFLVDEKNVGPQGVITASDLNNEVSFEEGDELIVTNKLNRSTAYIMALRIGYDL